MRRSLIVATAAGGVIGADNRLPWRLPADLVHFRALTMGHHLVMGRRTFESIGRPLPGRTTLVLTRDPAFTAAGVTVVPSLAAAFAEAEAAGDAELFVCGGAAVYAEALPLVERVYRTVIERSYPGDRRFVGFDERAWQRSSVEPHAEHDPPFRFETWERARRSP